MKILFVSRKKDNGILIYASSDYNCLIKITELYLKLHNYKNEYEVETVVGIEPSNKNKNNNN